MNSHSSGCTERVTMSRWSWRSLRISAWAIASVPAAIRASGPADSAAGGGGGPVRSPEPAGDAALCADIGQPPLLGARVIAERSSGDGGEHLFEAVGPVALEQLGRLALLDQASVVDDAEPVALALGLLHQVRGHENRRPCLPVQG